MNYAHSRRRAATEKLSQSTWRTGAFWLASAASLFSSSPLLAQKAPADSEKSDEDQTIVLSPFVVESNNDSGYSARETLAGTRIRTDLKDVASSISVVTKKFLNDTNSHNAADLLVYTPNTEVAGITGNFSGMAGQTSYNERTINPGSSTRVRGLDAADNTRNFFITDIPFDTYNTDRIDLQRGPNSILFGIGSPAGIINASLNDASFKTHYHLENVVSKHGSLRDSMDLNQVLVPQVLAIRFSALQDNQKFQQQEAYNNSTRYYGALRFDPKIFSDDVHSSFRANAEIGRVTSNNPRSIPPVDAITPWFSTTSEFGVPAINKATINPFTPGQGAGSNYARDRGFQTMGRSNWSNPQVVFDNSSGLPKSVMISQVAPSFAIDANGNMKTTPFQTGGSNGTIAGLPNYNPLGLSPYSSYASRNLSGGSYYSDKVLTDPSVFDFFNHLLDGDNKREWQKWHTLDLAWEQSFFRDRVGYQIAYDQQMYESGSNQMFSGNLYAINVDVTETRVDGSPNPNLGRPYIASGGGADGSTKTKINRDTTRATAFGEFRAADVWGTSLLAKIIGVQRATGLYSLEHRKSTSVQWTPYATASDYPTQAGLSQNEIFNTFRNFNFVDYLGPSMLGRSTASGANIDPVKVPIVAPRSTQVWWFDSHWKASRNPSDPTYVDPAASYTYLDSNSGASTNSTQSNNPANYVGWKQIPITYLDANNPQDFPSLVTGGEKTRFRDVSKALVYQGFWFDGTLAATYGWRKDQITSYDTAALPGNDGVAPIDYTDNPASRLTASGQTRTWGGVYHLPKTLTKYLPWDSTVSVFYNRAQNFFAGAPRFNLAGEQIANPTGLTKEYGVAVTTLSDKLTFKATHYETTVHNAKLTGDALASLGGASWKLPLFLAWGYGYASEVQLGLDGRLGNATRDNNNWNYAVTDAVSVASKLGQSTPDLSVIGTPEGSANLPIGTYAYGGTGTVTMRDIVNAWLNLPVSDNFFNFWGISGNRPDPAKARTNGKLYEGWTTPAGATGDIPGLGGQQFAAQNSPISTADNISTGWEFELSGQPTKNWNVTVNFSKTEATKTNIDPVTTAFMEQSYKFYTGPGGQLRLWGAGQTAGSQDPTNLNSTPNLPPVYAWKKGEENGSTLVTQWVDGVYNPYLVLKLAQGQSTPEVSPWRLNLISTYTFDRGAVKGLFAGGAARLEAGRILAYGLDDTTGIVDPRNKYIGPNDEHFDVWVGYRRKFALRGHSLDWRIQLNFRNVGEKTRLIASQYEPAPDANGKYVMALARIQEGMTWSLTNSFDF